MILASNIVRTPRKQYGNRPEQDRLHTLFFKQYALFCMDNKTFKTCGRVEALKLLATGRWFDKTRYSAMEIENNEVLSYGTKENDESEEPNCIKLESGNQSQYKLDNPNKSDDAGEEHCSEAIRTECATHQVKRQGRSRGK